MTQDFEAFKDLADRVKVASGGDTEHAIVLVANLLVGLAMQHGKAPELFEEGYIGASVALALGTTVAAATTVAEALVEKHREAQVKARPHDPRRPTHRRPTRRRPTRGGRGGK